MSLLEMSVTAEESDSVLTLAGKAYASTVAVLRRTLSAQIDGGGDLAACGRRVAEVAHLVALSPTRANMIIE